MIAVGVGGLVLAPLWAGWIVYALYLGLIGLPSLFLSLANRDLGQQRFSAHVPLYVAALVLHPRRSLWDAARGFQAITLADAGDVTGAISLMKRIAGNPRTLPAQALFARFWHDHLEGRTAEFADDPAVQRETSPSAVAARMAAAGFLNRTSDLVALEAAHGASFGRLAPGRGLSRGNVLIGLFSATGRVDPLRRLLDTYFKRMRPDQRAYWLTTAQHRAGLPVGRTALERLTTSRHRTVARDAVLLLKDPHPVAVLSPDEAVVLDAAEAGMNAAMAAYASRPQVWHMRVTIGLVALSLMAFGWEFALDDLTGRQLLLHLGVLRPDRVVLCGQWWVLGPALFLHAGWTHLTVNLIGLAVLCAWTEYAIGRWRTLLVFAASGLGSMAAALGTILSGLAPDRLELGTSPALAGLLGALVVQSVKRWRRDRAPVLNQRWLRVSWGVVLLLLLDLATPHPNVLAHAAGAMTGAALAMVFRAPLRDRPKQPAAPALPVLSRWHKALIVLSFAIGLVTAFAAPDLLRHAEAGQRGAEAESITPVQLAGLRSLRLGLNPLHDGLAGAGRF